jgi:hypothetical protein
VSSTWFAVAINRDRRASRRHFVPCVAALEGRALPSTFTVLNLADSGDGSLRAAVQAAETNPGPDAVAFAKGVHGTITLTSGELVISSDLAIVGPGADKLAVSGNNSSRVFDVIGGTNENTRVTVSIAGLTISRGRDTIGAGLRNSAFSDLTLSQVALSDNHALSAPDFDSLGGGAANTGTGARLSVLDSVVAGNGVETTEGDLFGGGGGGIYSDGTGLTVANSVVMNNQVCSRPDFEAFGGGLFVRSGALTVTSSAISGNQVVAGDLVDGGFYFTVAGGGGIEAMAGATAAISKCTIADNKTVAGAGTESGEFGIAAGGGLQNIFGATTTLTDCTVRDNRAIGRFTGHAQGGGVANEFQSTMTVSHCALSGNQAIGGDGGPDGSPYGGAINNGILSFLAISDSIVERNQAVGGNHNTTTWDNSIGTAFGGGISNGYLARLEITRCSLRWNQAVGGNQGVGTAPNESEVGGADGGALWNSVGTQTVIRDSTIEHNQAVGGTGNSASGPTAFAGTAAGGGINNQVDGGPFGYGRTQVTVVDCTIRDNEALGGAGNTASGGMPFAGAGLGGGVANYFGAATEIDGSRLEHDRAVGGMGNSISGGAVPAGLGAGGAVFNAIGNFELDWGGVLAASVVNVTNSTLEHNQALGGHGNALIHGSDGWGGGLANMFTATTNLAGSLVALNLALGGDGNGGGNGLGGGAFDDDTSALALTESTVTENHANGGDGEYGGSDGQGIGGGVYNLGSLGVDALTRILQNLASTDDDDLFA